VIPKAFVASIYYELYPFQSNTKELPIYEEILISSIVENITAEARSFVLNGVIKDIALYEGYEDLDAGRKFLLDFLAEYGDQIPNTLVIDIGYSKHEGWFVIEFNASWGSGLNNCKAENVLECIIEATINH
jgi:hypothetical protein